MKKTLGIVLLALLLVFQVQIQAQVQGEEQGNETALSMARFDVAYLASDLLEGRETGTEGARLAAEYIVLRLQQMGIEPKGSDGYYHQFDFKHSTNPHVSDADKESRTGRNVAGFIDNGAEHTIVIGGHYDHLGYGAFGSLHTGDKAIHNGADDNASGIAVMLQLAQRLTQMEEANYNFLFIAFSGEEMGLFGSKNFVKTPTVDIADMNCMINMDMVGRLNDEKVLVINGVGTSPAWNEMLEEIDVHGIKATTTESGIGASDHTSFYLEDLPAIHFFTGQHNDYHRPADDSHLINYEGLLEVTDYIMALIEQLNEREKLEFTKTKDESERQAAAFKVSLGVMPDYTYQGGDGMRIDAVREGRPGEKAGLEDGDVVIKLGDVKVTDMYSYMEALSKFKKGDKAEVVVKRGKKKVRKEVEFK
jgi:hypothetical protein